ncbi:MarR family winged helix-turn-helix transcriptional regulator [Bacillus songklensis]|uniref:MarR family winged helix-turn-helix transcriptional regulator n=1 Tax=Bacillus songklensis TaxID=1069116 RepID=A0ABV8BB50_9BACI
MNELNGELKKQLEIMHEVMEIFIKYNKKLIKESNEESPYKLTPTKYYMLKMIYNAGTCMVMDVARKLDLSSGATTIILKQLEEEDLIIRLRDKDDRRVVWLRLTDAGKAFIEKKLEKRDKFLLNILSKLSAEERSHFLGLLEKMAGEIKEEIEKSS